MKGVFILLAVSLSLAARCANGQVPAPTGPAPAAPANDSAPAVAASAPAAPTNDPAAATAAAIAAKQAADERYERMSADIESLRMDNESMKAKIASSDQKIDELRQQLTTANNSLNGLLEDLKRVAESITAVDKKREEDKQANSDEIRKVIDIVKKAVASAPAPIREPPPKLQPDTETPATANVFIHVMKEGEYLSAVVAAYNAKFKEQGWKQITTQQAEAANPDVTDWSRVHVGKEIKIPNPQAP